MIVFYLLLFVATFYVLLKHFLPKIQNFPPSPFPTLPVIGHLYLLKKPLHRTLTTISNRYGPVVLLNFGYRPILIVSSPSAAEECFTRNDIIFANRPRLLIGKYAGYNYTTLTWSSYGDHWRNLRRISSLEILSSQRIQTLSHIRIDEVRSLISRLLRTDQKQAVDMKSTFFELTLNVIMRMIAGKRYCGDRVEEAEEASKFREMVAENFRLGSVSNIEDFLPMLRWAGNGVVKRLIKLQQKRDSLMQSLIEEHRRMRSCGAENYTKNKKNKTMIEVLLDLQEWQPEYYKDEIIRGIMLVIIAGGTDTTSSTMEWAMSLLVNNTHVRKKVQTEIDTVVGHDRLIDESDLPKLPYLHCIINETLRMYPPGPLLIPHESSEDCQLGGFHVQRGTTILVNMWAIHRDPNIWEDPTSFKPERFEGCEGIKDGLKFRFLPFGSGRRGCPGENFAMRMVGLALGSLLQCFEWKKIGEEMVEMREQDTGLTLTKAQPLKAYCRPRPSNLNLLSQV
ncbi:hypothetical protein I3842_15G047200 [Carya illinoinensis]|uniref:Cytochrome P450 n=1 Tax=Carya illinoinensis TaxID=32201 RepID=A0A922A8Y7_CARIL|nr:hypothetical protein I3842_15G047200 [Carya illinoinensis]